MTQRGVAILFIALGLCNLYGETKTSLSLNIVATSIGEAKVSLFHTRAYPCLQGGGPLTRDNSLDLTLGAAVSPLSVNGLAEVRLTPIAFLQVFSGVSAGSGWNLPIADGLRMNERKDEHDNALTGGAFEGLVLSARAGGVFRFDLASLFPGEWNHVVFQTSHEARYRRYTAAKEDESWLFEADTGENRNGWVYASSWFAGYAMPLKVSMAGVYMETEMALYQTAGGKLWGENLVRFVFGPLVNIDLTRKVSTALLAQWHTERIFTRETANYGFYQDRRMAEGESRSVSFYRLVLNATVKLP